MGWASSRCWFLPRGRRWSLGTEQLSQTQLKEIPVGLSPADEGAGRGWCCQSLALSTARAGRASGMQELLLSREQPERGAFLSVSELMLQRPGSSHTDELQG